MCEMLEENVSDRYSKSHNMLLKYALYDCTPTVIYKGYMTYK